MVSTTDPRVLELFQTRTSACLPGEHHAKAYRVIRLVGVAKTFGALTSFTHLAKLDDGRLAAPNGGKWIITFNWVEGFGAEQLLLQRL